MTSRAPSVVRRWRFALVGGLFSIPLTVGEYWLSGAGPDLSATPVVVGGAVAGYLARRHTASAATAGVGAGLVGGLPAYVRFVPPVVRSAATWPSPAGWAFALLVAVAVVAVVSLAGGVGGLVGGWLATRLDGRRSSTAGS